MSDTSIESVLKDRLDQSISGFAEKVETLGRDLKTSQPDDLIDDLSAYARRNPVSFLAGAAALGFAAMRFAPAGSSLAETQSGPDGKHLRGSHE